MKKFKVYYRETRVYERTFEANDQIESAEIAYHDIRKNIDKWVETEGMTNLELSAVVEVFENTNQ